MAERFQILALSGGGFRGLYTAEVLARLEAENGGEPLARRFDLVTGTSIGAILALGLACEIPAAKLASIFEAEGPNIFPRRGISGFLSRVSNRYDRTLFGLFRARYGAEGLRAALERETIFGKHLIDHCFHPVWSYPASVDSLALGSQTAIGRRFDLSCQSACNPDHLSARKSDQGLSPFNFDS